MSTLLKATSLETDYEDAPLYLVKCLPKNPKMSEFVLILKKMTNECHRQFSIFVQKLDQRASSKSVSYLKGFDLYYAQLYHEQ